jgi:hypothetical protein
MHSADTGRNGEGAGRPATDTGRDRSARAPALAVDADPKLLVVGGD